jgi:hypothetical protein
MLTSLLFVILITLGCSSTSSSVKELGLPGKSIAVIASKTKILTAEQRIAKKRQLEARIRLLEMLTQIEQDIKSKQKKANFFSFALKEDDQITLAAAEILLKHIKRSKREIELEIKQLHEDLN